MILRNCQFNGVEFILIMGIISVLGILQTVKIVIGIIVQSGLADSKIIGFQMPGSKLLEHDRMVALYKSYYHPTYGKKHSNYTSCTFNLTQTRHPIHVRV